MKYDNQVYRKAANKIITKSTNLMGKYLFACSAISECSDSENREKYLTLFIKFFKPKRSHRDCGWWSNYCNYTKESQLARQIALDLMAEMIEQGDI